MMDPKLFRQSEPLSAHAYLSTYPASVYYFPPPYHNWKTPPNGRVLFAPRTVLSPRLERLRPAFASAGSGRPLWADSICKLTGHGTPQEFRDRIPNFITARRMTRLLGYNLRPSPPHKVIRAVSLHGIKPPSLLQKPPKRGFACLAAQNRQGFVCMAGRGARPKERRSRILPPTGGRCGM